MPVAHARLAQVRLPDLRGSLSRRCGQAVTGADDDAGTPQQASMAVLRVEQIRSRRKSRRCDCGTGTEVYHRNCGRLTAELRSITGTVVHEVYSFYTVWFQILLRPPPSLRFSPANDTRHPTSTRSVRSPAPRRSARRRPLPSARGFSVGPAC